MFTIIIGYIVFVGILVILINWLTHLMMSVGDGKVIGWGSIKDFKREFVKYDWNNDHWSESGLNLWDRKSDCKYYAGQIQFNGIRMIMITPWDLLLTRSCVKSYMIKNKIPIKKSKGFHKWS